MRWVESALEVTGTDTPTTQSTPAVVNLKFQKTREGCFASKFLHQKGLIWQFKEWVDAHAFAGFVAFVFAAEA